MKRFNYAITTIGIFMKNQMQDKSNIFLDFLNMISRCFIVFLLYKYIFKLNGGTMNGVDYKTTMWSMFIYFCIMTFSLRKVYSQIMLEVKSGNVEMFMNKPVNYLMYSYYKIIGSGLFSFLTISFLGTIFMIIFLGVPIVNIKIFIPTFIITFLLGQILALLIYSAIGLLSFFINDVRPIYWIVDKFVMVLGGSYLPISLFPKALKLFAFISPFGAVNFATSTVFKSWESEYLIRFGIQILWIVISFIILMFIYKKSKEKAMINGG